MSDGPRIIHCWASKLEVEGHPPCTHGGHDAGDDSAYDCLYGNGATCLLEDGHPGEHVWTDDRDFSLSFGQVSEAR